MGTVTAFSLLEHDGSSRRMLPTALHQSYGPAEDEDARLELAYAYSANLLPDRAYSNEGMWRYEALLPLNLMQRHYPLPVGNTPLVGPERLREKLGTPGLWLKDETRSPTGSNKDRATALLLEHALQTGVKTVCCASTGNVAVSLAIGAAATGIRAVIFVPEQIAEAKLEILLLAGAQVFKVKGGYEQAVRLSRLAVRTFGWYERNTGYHPFTVEAKKTVALEIWEQLGRQVPDVVVVPVGDGVTLCGMAKGFRELLLCGAIHKVPRLIGVQATGCQPLVVAWEGHKAIQAAEPQTLADGIAVPMPINGVMALRDVRESNGQFLAVSDASLLWAVKELLSGGGILAEPAAAASWAGLQVALQSGIVKRDETIVALITGTGLKTLALLRTLPTVTAHTVHAEIEEVRRLIEC